MKVKKVTIFTNTTKLNTEKVSQEMKCFLENKGIDVEIVKLASNESDLTIEKPSCDLAVSLGGDGTVLTCAQILYGTQIPLLAVNLGTFGYITETSIDEYKDVIEDYLTDKAESVDRMRLTAKVVRQNNIIFESSALNDISVSSNTRAKAARLNLSINSTFAASLKGDGIIIATPTGSTAYNLSAGGPILEETLNSIIINPICSFTLSARPLVIDENSKVEISIPQQDCKTVVSADGHEDVSLQSGDVLLIEKSRYSTKLVKNNKRNSIDILRDKLGWAGGFNA